MSSTSFKKTDYGKLVRFQIPSHARYISHTRNYFFHLCLENGFSLYDALDLKLVLGEALSNIVSHAYDGNANKPIFIDLHFDTERVEIRIRDYGRKTEPKDLKSFDLNDYREGGIGLYLIKKLTDYYYLDLSVEVGNQLVLIKRK